MWSKPSATIDPRSYGPQLAREERLAGTTREDVFFLADFLPVTFFTALRGFGRLRDAARCAAARAALAQPDNSSGSSKSRAGNCQYELTVTVLALV